MVQTRSCKHKSCTKAAPHLRLWCKHGQIMQRLWCKHGQVRPIDCGVNTVNCATKTKNVRICPDGGANTVIIRWAGGGANTATILTHFFALSGGANTTVIRWAASSGDPLMLINWANHQGLGNSQKVEVQNWVGEFSSISRAIPSPLPCPGKCLATRSLSSSHPGVSLPHSLPS